MKFAAILTLGGLLALAAPAGLAQPPGGLERVSLAGHDYVRLQDLAQAAKLQTRWVEPNKVVSLTGPSRSLEFTADAAVATVNGVNVWLSFPVIVRAGVPCVSYLDWQTTLRPLLAGSASGSRLKLVVLDPGHGGKDTGNRCGSQNEKKYTLLLANEVRDQLKRAGIKAVLTRTSDTYVDLDERPAIARRLGADLFVSLHFNASEEDPRHVEGAETYCLTPVGASSTNSRGEGADSPASDGNQNNDRNLRLAYAIHRSLTQNLQVEDRGVRRARFAVLRDATMPAVLIEGGFMSHPQEGKKIFTAAYRHQLAQAIVSGILAYQHGGSERAASPSPLGGERGPKAGEGSSFGTNAAPRHVTTPKTKP
jgi:N-acetylmuramoyl-L-alanine amidase